MSFSSKKTSALSLLLLLISCGKPSTGGHCTAVSEASNDKAAVTSIGGFIERKVYTTGTSEEVEEKPVLCSAAFRFDTSAMPWTLEFTTLNNPDCFTFSYTHELTFKPYWNGKYLDIPLELDTFAQRKKMVQSTKDFDLDLQKYLLKIFDPKKTFDLVQKWDSGEDKNKPEMICSASDTNCTDFLGLWTIKINLPEKLKKNTQKAIQEMEKFQKDRDKEFEKSFPGALAMVSEIRKLRSERTEIDRKYSIIFPYYLLDECSNTAFKNEDFVGYETKELRNAFCKHKAIAEPVLKSVKLGDLSSEALVKNFNQSAKKSLDDLESKIRSSIQREEKLLKDLLKVVKASEQKSFSKNFFFASNHLKTKSAQIGKIAYSAISVGSKLQQVSGAQFSYNGKQFVYTDGVEERAKKALPNEKDRLEAVRKTNLGIQEQKGSSFSLANVLPIALMRVGTNESGTSAILPLPRATETGEEETVAVARPNPPPTNNTGEANTSTPVTTTVTIPVTIQPGKSANPDSGKPAVRPTVQPGKNAPATASSGQGVETTGSDKKVTQERSEGAAPVPQSASPMQPPQEPSESHDSDMVIESPQVVARGC